MAMWVEILRDLKSWLGRRWCLIGRPRPRIPCVVQKVSINGGVKEPRGREKMRLADPISSAGIAVIKEIP